MPVDSPIITAYSDGSCLGNPGPGGWAVAILSDDGTTRTLTGGEDHTTNNRMELTGAIEALRALPADVPSVLFCDSEYVVRGATEWRKGWERRNWRNASGKAVANPDLWRVLYEALDARPLVTMRWVRGHAGNAGNEAVDRLAQAEAAKRKITGRATEPAPFGRMLSGSAC